VNQSQIGKLDPNAWMLVIPFNLWHLTRNTLKSINMQRNMTGEITETVTVSMRLPAPAAREESAH